MLAMAIDLLANLNPQQKQSVTHGEGPLLIVAGAGTGKTTVVTSRVAWLMTQGKAAGHEVLALTFTDKAAGEMEERIDRLVPYGTVDLWVSTFHAFCQRVLSAHAIEAGLPGNFRLLNTTQQWLLVRANLDQFALKYYRPLGNPTKFIHALVSHFSRAKDEAVSPEEYLRFARELALNTDAENFLQQLLTEDERASLTANEVRQLAAQEIAKINEVAAAYHTYQQLLLKQGAFDFGDLIAYTLKLFRERPKILAKYRAQFKYLLVDEFQDTNWAQYELVKLLAEPKRNLTVVGDDDQCLPAGTLVKTPGGSKPIEAIAVGDQVIAAVGRGYVAAQSVARVFRRTKLVRLVTFTTARGLRVTVTDNHKMFCLVPAVDDRRYHYVYLMERRGLGWRIGVTNDLASRLRLERSADRILGVRTCTTDAEARYYETFYSLTYGIPTVCFAPREGVAIQGDWLPRLYRELDVEAGVRRLADDGNLDLGSHHASLGAVKRGGKLRVKISLEMCHRRYSSKHARRGVLQAPWVAHGVQLETSDPEVLRRLRRAGFTLTRGKRNGYRLRMVSQDLASLGRVVGKLERVTGGIVEVSGKLGRTFRRSRKSLVMPAKNVLVGQYLPVVTARGVMYDRVVSKRQTFPRTTTVYDLEVAGAHNFTANGIVVHNSVYKFRGASVANILQFKQDFPAAKEIFLTTNYRSRQGILDSSYRFIQLNNPERLEVMLVRTAVAGNAGAPALSKKLVASREGVADILHLTAATAEDEVRAVVGRIQELKERDSALTWSDFAILARANDHLQGFDYGLQQAEIPCQLYAARGLYRKPVVLDLVAFLKLLDNYHESPAMYRVLTWRVLNLPQRDIITLNYWSRRKARSLYQTVRDAAAITEIDAEAQATLKRVIALIDEHAIMTRTRGVRDVMLSILEASGYLRLLTRDDTREQLDHLNYLNQFFQKVSDFEATAADRSVGAFLRQLELELEAGDAGALAVDVQQGPDAVKLMTVHAAKGLEFTHVFVVNMVERRFPTTERAEAVPLPNGLIKERLPVGDVHLQEERRLFYVAVTRAKDSVTFSSASSYGGTRAKKPSQFLTEIGVIAKPALVEPSGVVPQLGIEPGESQPLARGRREYYRMPAKFSYSQLKAYETCPWKYRFAFLLRVPVRGRAVFSFGQTIHAVLQHAYALVMSRQGVGQGSLFTAAAAAPGNQAVGKLLTLKELEQLYREYWVDDWYANPDERERYFAHGQKLLAEYYTSIKNQVVSPRHLEQGFNLKLEDEASGRQHIVYGKIDRVDERDGKLSIIDYKTGQPKRKLDTDDKEQLLIYQLAANEIFGTSVEQLTLHYLEGNLQQHFLGTEKDLVRMKSKILTTIAEIERGEFVPTPGRVCATCEFRDICEYRAV